MKIIAITRTDGVSIMRLIDDQGDITDCVNRELAAWHQNERSKVVSWREIQEADIPTDRTFRGAWEDTGSITVDMPKAREIHRNRLREARKPKLEALDREYLKADEAENLTLKIQIASQKQVLRDITSNPAIDNAPNPVALKAFWPQELA